MHWYLDVLKKYATFSGRARRKEYWLFLLFNYLICTALSVVSVLLFGIGGMSKILVVYTLLLLLPGLAVQVRRLHDTNRSGWWLLICLVPFVGAIALIVVFCRDDPPGRNRFGDSVKYSYY